MDAPRPVGAGAPRPAFLLLGAFLALIDPGRIDRLSLFRRRIAVAQTGYAAAALLCVANTYVSVAALAVVELCFIV